MRTKPAAASPCAFVASCETGEGRTDTGHREAVCHGGREIGRLAELFGRLATKAEFSARKFAKRSVARAVDERRRAPARPYL